MKKPSLRERLRYRFDNYMSKGSMGLIQLLVIATLVVVLIMTGLIMLFQCNDESSIIAVFWDNLATAINAWMPYSDDGTVGYVILSAVTALVGVLFTSILIGIFSSAIEEKVDNLKKGNSNVLEQDHIVLLGFAAGEYELLTQLVLAGENDGRCIVVADEMEKDEMESCIRENVDIPRGVSLICRNVDITDAVALECLSIERSRCVVVSPGSDERVVKSILAVVSLTKDLEIPVVAQIASSEFLLPQGFKEEHHILMIRTNDIIARIIARASAQPGLSGAYLQMFDFNGSEIYLEHRPETAGWTFNHVNTRMNHGVAVGIFRDGTPILNPPFDTEMQAEDGLIVFEPNLGACVFEECPAEALNQDKNAYVRKEKAESLAIIGCNRLFSTVVSELPENIRQIMLINTDEAALSEEEAAALRLSPAEIIFAECPLNNEEALGSLIKGIQHVIVLSESENGEDSDFEVMLQILRLREVRKSFGLTFTITAEMKKESSRRLIEDEQTDFIVSTNISAMFLAQMVENPMLQAAFNEILSQEGNELYYKLPSAFGCCGENRVVRLRRTLAKNGFVFLGYVKKSDSEEREFFFNPPFDSMVELSDEDRMIVLGI